MTHNITIPSWIQDLSGGNSYILIAIAGIMPGLEPRYSILIGIYLGLDLALITIISVIEVLGLSLALTLVIGYLDKVLEGIPVLSRTYQRYRKRVMLKAKSKVDKWGSLGLVIFIAIPLPATGIYTGSLAGLLLGFRGLRLTIILVAGGLLSLSITLLLSKAII